MSYERKLTMLTIAILACVFSLAAGQCSIPAPFSNGNLWQSSSNGIALKVTLGSSSSGVVDLSGTNYTLTCDGMMTSTSEYYGRLTVAVNAFITAQIGFCMKLRTPSSSSTVQGFQWRSNLTALPASLGIINVVYPGGFGVSNPVSYATACDAGGDRPEYETNWLDTSSGGYTPGNCPTVWQNNFTYVVSPGASCNHRLDGVTNPSQLSVTAVGCTAAIGFFDQNQILHCLHSFTANGVDFLLLQNTTTATGSVFCAAYSTSGSVTSATFTKGACEANQTATVATGTHLAMLATSLSPTSVPGTGGSGGIASTLVPSLLLLISALCAALQR